MILTNEYLMKISHKYLMEKHVWISYYLGEYLHLSVFHMVTGMNESKILTKHVSCKLKSNLMEENVI